MIHQANYMVWLNAPETFQVLIVRSVLILRLVNFPTVAMENEVGELLVAVVTLDMNFTPLLMPRLLWFPMFMYETVQCNMLKNE